MDQLSIQRMIQENQWYKAEVAKLQKQLEEETFGISGEQQNVKRLKSQARAQFAGQSGIATGSLSRKKQT